ncbi:MAG TPA: hypothetical protein VHF25_09795, partial [Nitriliruptorales bacterium]|nr:hypothetical protein [Nitriliruptorales bacterium]
LGEQDQRLAAMVRDAGCGVVLLVNKWDLVDDQRRDELERELDRLLGFTDWAPRVNVSAHTGRGLERLIPWLTRVLEAHRTRIPTGELNTWLQQAVDRTPPPPGRGGSARRPKYVTQVAVGPPTFVAFGASLEASYRRYLERSLRERFGFVGTPLRIEDRPSRRRGRRA